MLNEESEAEPSAHVGLEGTREPQGLQAAQGARLAARLAAAASLAARLAAPLGAAEGLVLETKEAVPLVPVGLLAAQLAAEMAQAAAAAAVAAAAAAAAQLAKETKEAVPLVRVGHSVHQKARHLQQPRVQLQQLVLQATEVFQVLRQVAVICTLVTLEFRQRLVLITTSVVTQLFLVSISPQIMPVHMHPLQRLKASSSRTVLR